MILFFSNVLLKTVSRESCRKLRINNTMFVNAPETVRFHFECGRYVVVCYLCMLGVSANAVQ